MSLLERILRRWDEHLRSLGIIEDPYLGALVLYNPKDNPIKTEYIDTLKNNHNYSVSRGTYLGRIRNRHRTGFGLTLDTWKLSEPYGGFKVFPLGKNEGYFRPFDIEVIGKKVGVNILEGDFALGIPENIVKRESRIDIAHLAKEKERRMNPHLVDHWIPFRGGVYTGRDIDSNAFEKMFPEEESKQVDIRIDSHNLLFPIAMLDSLCLQRY